MSETDTIDKTEYRAVIQYGIADGSKIVELKSDWLKDEKDAQVVIEECGPYDGEWDSMVQAFIEEKNPRERVTDTDN